MIINVVQHMETLLCFTEPIETLLCFTDSYAYKLNILNIVKLQVRLSYAFESQKLAIQTVLCAYYMINFTINLKLFMLLAMMFI